MNRPMGTLLSWSLVMAALLCEMSHAQVASPQFEKPSGMRHGQVTDTAARVQALLKESDGFDALPSAPTPHPTVESSSVSGIAGFELTPYRAPRRGKRVWGPTTSGPFFTGTAEVEPLGSSYVEPFLFSNQKKGSSSNVLNQKMAMGLGNNLEFDAQMPMVVNTVSGPSGQTVTQSGPGDLHLDVKYQLTQDANTSKLFARPALGLTTDFYFPTGKFSGLQPSLYGADQFGNGTFQQGMSLLIHKRVEPFSLYGQVGDLIADPTHVSQGYGYDNGVAMVTSGQNVRMVDGNLLYYSGAIEYVMNTKHGVGVLAEMNGQSQSSRNLIFGKATAPAYSYLAVAPEVEFTTPMGKHAGITWGAGVDVPVERGNFPRVVTPMVTATFYFNGPNGGRSSE